MWRAPDEAFPMRWQGEREWGVVLPCTRVIYIKKAGFDLPAF